MPGRPVWVGVAILLEDGTTDTWQMNINDGPIQVRSQQAGLTFRGPVPSPEVLATYLVDTMITVSGKARRWGPDAQSGSTFRIPEQPKELNK